MIRHLAGITEVVDDVAAAKAFYDEIGLHTRDVAPGYVAVDVDGVPFFALADRGLVARATHGADAARDAVPVGFIVGFEVDDVADAATALGQRLISGPTEEFQQVTARYRSPSGMPCEMSETPTRRELDG